jgi:alpha-beta hydrolase superfamily lysophospholipase
LSGDFSCAVDSASDESVRAGFGKTATYTPKHTQGVTSWPEQFEDIRHFLALVLEKYPSVPIFLFGACGS